MDLTPQVTRDALTLNLHLDLVSAYEEVEAAAGFDVGQRHVESHPQQMDYRLDLIHER